MVGQQLTDREWRGQSETIAVAAMAAVAIILVAAIGFFLLSGFGSDDTEVLLTNMEAELTPDELSASHGGGDTLQTDDVLAIVEGSGISESILLSEFPDDDEGRLSAGQSVTKPTTDFDGVTQTLLGEFDVLLVHEPTNTVLFDETFTLGVADSGGVVITFAGADDVLTIVGEDDTAADTGEQLVAVADELLWDYAVTLTPEDGETVDVTEDVHPDEILFGGSDTLEVVEPGLIRARQPTDSTEVVTVETASAFADVELGVSGFDSNQVAVTVVEAQHSYVVDAALIDIDGPELVFAGDVENAGDLTNPSADIEFSITEFVSATGDVRAAESTIITTSTGQLAPGENTTFSHTYTIQDTTGEVDQYNVTIAPDRQSDRFNDIPFEQAFGVEPATFTVDATGALVTDIAGDRFEVDYTVKNTGDVLGTQDITFDAVARNESGGTVADTTAVVAAEQIGGGDDATGTFNFDLPVESASEIVTLSATVTTDDDAETVTLNVTPAGFDIEIDDWSVDPGIEQGEITDSLTVNATVANTGDLTDSVTVELVENPVYDSELVTVLGGTSESVSLTAFGNDPIPVGVPIELVVQADDLEIDVDDSITLQFDGSEFAVDADFNFESGELNVSYTVTNTGDLSGIQDVELLIDNSSSNSETDVGLVPNDSVAGNFTATIDPAAEFTATVTSDDDSVSETFSELTLSSLEIDVSFEPELNDDEQLVFAYNITNTPDADFSVTEPVTLAVTGPESLGTTATLTEVTLAPGASDGESGVTTDQVTEGGEYTVTVEAGEDDGSGTFDVTEPVISITMDIAETNEDDELVFAYSIENDASADLTASEEVLLSVTGPESPATNADNHEQTVEIAPGDLVSESEVTTESLSVGGTYDVTAAYGGDTGSDSFEVTGPEFSVSDVEATRGDAFDTIVIDYHLANDGGLTGEPTVDISISGPDGLTFTLQDDETEAIAPSGDVELTFETNSDSESLIEGSYTVEVTVGSSSDTDDVTFQLESDVTITGIETGPGDGTGVVEVTYQIANTGTFAGDIELTLELDNHPSTDTATETVQNLNVGDTETGLTLIASLEDSAETGTARVSSPDDSDTEPFSPKEPTFEVSDESLSTNFVDVKENEALEYIFDIENTGDVTGTADVALLFAGTQKASGEVTVAGGESETAASIPYTPDRSDVEDNSGETTVELEIDGQPRHTTEGVTLYWQPELSSPGLVDNSEWKCDGIVSDGGLAGVCDSWTDGWEYHVEYDITYEVDDPGGFLDQVLVTVEIDGGDRQSGDWDETTLTSGETSPTLTYEKMVDEYCPWISTSCATWSLPPWEIDDSSDFHFTFELEDTVQDSPWEVATLTDTAAEGDGTGGVDADLFVESAVVWSDNSDVDTCTILCGWPWETELLGLEVDISISWEDVSDPFSNADHVWVEFDAQDNGVGYTDTSTDITGGSISHQEYIDDVAEEEYIVTVQWRDSDGNPLEFYYKPDDEDGEIVTELKGTFTADD